MTQQKEYYDILGVPRDASEEDIKKMVKISDEISDLVFEFKGSFSGEHGDGIVRGAWTKKMYGEKVYRAFQELKKSFDPLNILNPGKIIDCI